jgi:hypothetical protein
MRRFLSLAALLLFALPVGLSVTGCVTNVSAYCNNAGYGAKLTDIYAVRLPSTQSAEGISLAWGQSAQVGTATATNCRGTTVSTGTPTYGTTDLENADISPTGVVCAGKWNRNSQGGIPDYTICTASSVSETAQITASVGGVTSNPVTVYVHPPISAVTFTAPTDCISSGTVTAPNYFVNQTTVYDQDGAIIPSASSGASNVVGTIQYAPQTAAIVSINNTNVPTTTTSSTGTSSTTYGDGTATANQPGGTVITATVGGGGNNAPGTTSTAGYFYTCPPVSASLTLPASTNTTSSSSNIIPITAGNPQTLTVSLVDKNGTAITPTTGSSLDYTSTSPQQVSVSTAGLVTSVLPGYATITGICQPGTATSSTTTTTTSTSTATGQSCNPTPLNELGTFGTGLPITANPVQVSSPGNDNTYLWAASPDSQQFTPFDLSLSTGGTPTLLPYKPNSMVLDPTGTDLYFGSYRELMIYATATNSLSIQDTTVPGVVLAVSPSNNQVVIADQLRQVIYLYTPAHTTSGSTATTAASVVTTGGIGTHAVFSPDGKNVYVIGPTALYVHNIATGWSEYPLTSANATTSCELDNTNTNPFCSPDIAITVPSVAVFLSGSPVTARSFCPDTTTSPVTYNPLAATVTGDAADHLAATDDGDHILGANTTELYDIEHSPTGDTTRLVAPTGPCPGVVSGTAGPLAIQTTLRQLALTGITPTQIDQVLTSPDSARAFITYTASAATGLLPMYLPSSVAGGTGTLSNIQLAGGAQAPIAGVFSADSTEFFVSTTGDNLIHEIKTATGTDTLQLNPQLTDPTTGAAVPAQFLATKAKATS